MGGINSDAGLCDPGLGVKNIMLTIMIIHPITTTPTRIIFGERDSFINSSYTV